MWLYHSVLLDALKESKPTPGEKVAVLYHGEQTKKDAVKAGRDGTDPKDRYHNYSVVMPDRPAEDVSVSWDDVQTSG